MADPNTQIIKALKTPKDQGRIPAGYTSFMQRLDPSVRDEIEDRRGWPPGWTNANTAVNASFEDINNLLKYGISTNAGDKLSSKAGYYDIDNHPLKELSNLLF